MLRGKCLYSRHKEVTFLAMAGPSFVINFSARVDPRSFVIVQFAFYKLRSSWNSCKVCRIFQGRGAAKSLPFYNKIHLLSLCNPQFKYPVVYHNGSQVVYQIHDVALRQLGQRLYAHYSSVLLEYTLTLVAICKCIGKSNFPCSRASSKHGHPDWGHLHNLSPYWMPLLMLLPSPSNEVIFEHCCICKVPSGLFKESPLRVLRRSWGIWRTRIH